MMVAPALCTGCSGWFSRIALDFSRFSRHSRGSHTAPSDPRRIWRDPNGFWVVWTYLAATGCNWRSLDVLVGMSG